LKLEARNPKLEKAGLKQIGGKDLLALKYTPRKGTDLKITIFFEPDTFRHVRTEYSQTIYPNDQARIPVLAGRLPPDTNQRASNAHISAVEEFSDFKEEQGLYLPHSYKFQLSIQSDIRPALIDWTIDLSDFFFSAPFDAAAESAGDSPAFLDFADNSNAGEPPALSTSALAYDSRRTASSSDLVLKLSSREPSSSQDQVATPAVQRGR
jgi:hypothetical protein